MFVVNFLTIYDEILDNKTKPKVLWDMSVGYSWGLGDWPAGAGLESLL